MKFALLVLTVAVISTRTFAQDASPSTPVSSDSAVSTSTDAPASAPAASPTDSSSTPSTSTSTDGSSKKDPQVVKMITEKFGISADELKKYRDEKFGYGQIMLMLEMSKTTGKSMDDITSLMKKDKSLEKVAKELNLSKDDMKKMLGDLKPLREERKDQKEDRKDKKDKKDDRKDDRKEGRREDRKEDRREDRREERREERRDDRREERRDDRREERREDKRDDRRDDRGDKRQR